MGTNQWPEWMKPGIRVVRGPDYSGPTLNKDVVELGILTYVPNKVGDNKVSVVWDSGLERLYRSGATGNYELRAYDIQQIGVVHRGKVCVECRADPIRGVRFHCPDPKLDLCTNCYMEDKRDANKTFVRYDTPSSDGVRLPKRSLTKNFNRTLKGVFENASVVRGPHWNYDDRREGNSTDTGTVLSILPMKDGVSNGWVEVKWDISGKTDTYKFGAGGNVEVVGVDLVQRGVVHIEHLPVVGILELKIGNKVRINITLDEFKELQTKTLGDTGWIDSMKQCLQEVGTVTELTQDGDLARVQYKDGVMYILCKAALFREGGFRPGCVVTIIKDKAALNNLQQGHGEYCTEVCGELGRVLKVQQDGDMLVLVKDKTFVLSPVCCEPVDDPTLVKKAPKLPENMVQKNDASGFEDKMRSTILTMRKKDPSLDSVAKQMFDAFTDNDLPLMKNILNQHKQLVKYKMDEKTFVHIASATGNTELLESFIKLGADVQDKDGEGDTALHYAAFEQQVKCTSLLLKHKAAPDCQNNDGRTPLMISIDHPCIATIKVLVDCKASVGIKDKQGSTAMHAAVEQTDGQPEVTVAVLSASSADFTICNKGKINVFHWAVLKNNLKAVELILKKKPHMAKSTVSDGYTALHVAAANDFIEIASVLLDKGKIDPNSRDSNNMTPLHLATIQSHKRTAELLISKKADVNAQDKDGNTPLHLTQLSRIHSNLAISVSTRSTRNDDKIKITYILLEKLADMNIKNNMNQAPMDLVENKKTKEEIKRMAAKYQTDPLKSVNGVLLPMQWVAKSSLKVSRVPLDMKVATDVAEFNTVADHFRETLDYCAIVSIDRVQSQLLWEHFCLKKVEMEAEHGQGNANEIHLFHGTKPDLIDVIIKENFDFRIAGSNVGAILGNGSYFATTAKYSDSYTAMDQDHFRYMFVAKVLAGKPCVGKQGLKKPPSGYDSTVDNEKTTKVYCVFDKNQYYPEYVIKYRR